MTSQLDKDEQDPTEADEEAKKKTKQEQMHTPKKNEMRRWTSQGIKSLHTLC